MSKIGIIMRREYLNKVAKKSFLLLTILVPLIFAATVFIPMWLAGGDGESGHYAVIDQTGQYEFLFMTDTTYQFDILASSTNDSTRSAYDALILIEQDLKDEPTVKILSENPVKEDLLSHVKHLLDEYIEEQKLIAYGIPNIQQKIADAKTDIKVTTIRVDENGNENVSITEVVSVVGLVLSLLIYFFIFMYGGMVMNSVLQEKTNRIVEVLMCSVKPMELMMGKMLSTLLVGLTQLTIWVVFILFTIVLAQGYIQTTTPNITPEINDAIQCLGSIDYIEIILWFVILFIGGYMLYASIFAAIGAAVDNDTDTQQFVLPITLPLFFAIYVALYSIGNDASPLVTWTSQIPLTSPIVMMARIPFGVSLWEKVLSVVILYATAFITWWASAKIYRTGILLYGKKITWGDLWKWTIKN